GRGDAGESFLCASGRAAAGTGGAATIRRELGSVTAITEGNTADAGSEVEALRRCISDVVGLSTLSAVWVGASRARIAAGLSQVLHDTLKAELVCVGLRADPGGV